MIRLQSGQRQYQVIEYAINVCCLFDCLFVINILVLKVWREQESYDADPILVIYLPSIL